MSFAALLSLEMTRFYSPPGSWWLWTLMSGKKLVMEDWMTQAGDWTYQVTQCGVLGFWAWSWAHYWPLWEQFGSSYKSGLQLSPNPANPCLVSHPEHPHVQSKSPTRMWTAALHNYPGSQPRCISAGEWRNKLWWLTKEYYTAVKKELLVTAPSSVEEAHKPSVMQEVRHMRICNYDSIYT